MLTIYVLSTQVALVLMHNSFHAIDALITRNVATIVNDKAVDGHSCVAARTLTHGIFISADIFGTSIEIQRNAIQTVFRIRL